MWDQSKLSGSKVGRGKLRVNIGREDKKRGKFDLGGSLDDGKHPSKCKMILILSICEIYACFPCVVINHQKGGDCSKHDLICHLFELILVIHANTSNGTNHIV
jgi:hypothetical protein